MAPGLTSLQPALDRLLEAEYFFLRLNEASYSHFKYELNAFLSAARSVSFVMQKTMHAVSGFSQWYSLQQAAMRQDTVLKYFLELRNVSQKQGPVGMVIGLTSHGRGWEAQFAGNSVSVPDELRGVDLVDASAQHLGKLTNLVHACHLCFPFGSCPVCACTVKGLAATGLTVSDIEEHIGLPAGYSDVAGFPLAQRLFYLCQELQPFDSRELHRLKSNYPVGPLTRSDDALLTDIARAMEEAQTDVVNQRAMFAEAVYRRIQKVDDEGRE